MDDSGDTETIRRMRSERGCVCIRLRVSARASKQEILLIRRQTNKRGRNVKGI